jgi:hypothetical protein
MRASEFAGRRREALEYRNRNGSSKAGLVKRRQQINALSRPPSPIEKAFHG